MVFQNVGLLWIIENNNQTKFGIDVEDSQCMDNTTICTKLNGIVFQYDLKTGRNYRYELMCYFNDYYKEHA